MTQLDLARNSQAERRVRKLVEYRSAHYASHSEAASYFTNTPARVQFCFANPIICRLGRGHKIMSVSDSDAFDFMPGDVMFVPPGLEIDIDLSMARTDAPIECDWTNAMRQEIEQAFDMHAVDIYGLSEVMGPGVSMECVESKDGLHIWEDHF